MDNEQANRVALRIQIGEDTREVTFDELTLSNNLGLEALVKVLVDKGVFKPEDLQAEMDRIRKERYQDPAKS